MKRNCCGVLGVPENATLSEIKNAFRKLAKQYHSNVNPKKTKAEEKFKEVSEAYGVSIDPQKHQDYDQFVHEGVQSSFDMDGFQWSDLSHFSDFEIKY